MNMRALAHKAIAAVVLSGALAGFGAGVAEAMPMEHNHTRYCAKVISDYEFTGALYLDYLNRFGRDDRLTMQAESNYMRAVDAWVASSC